MATTYTLSQLRVEVAENARYDDGAGAVRTGKDLTSAMIDKYINRRYYEMLGLFINKYPEDYEHPTYANFYKATSTISTIVDTTLTAADAIFVTGMTGDRLYNSTRGGYIKIASVTSTTVVELESEPDSSWVTTDTFYVLGHEFPLGGDIADARYPLTVAVKYTTSDTYYKTCRWVKKTETMVQGSETYSTIAPVVYRTSSKVGGVLTPAIGILPEPSINIANGIEIRYAEMPPKLESDNDVPNLPLGTQHYLITGATIDALRKLEKYDKAREYEREWKEQKQMAIMDYAKSAGQPGLSDQFYRDHNLRTRAI